MSLDRLFMDVAIYNTRVMGAAHVQNVTELACRTALYYRGVAHLNFPVDLQDQEAKDYSKRNIPNHVSAVAAHSARMPAESDVSKAAEILNGGKRIVILAGAGALNATDELIQVAEKLSAPIVKALLGKAAVPDDSPYTTGGIGLLGTKPSQEAIEDCDTLLIAGTAFPYLEFYPKPGQARAIQIDIDPARIGLRYPVEVGIVADCRQTLQTLLPRLKTNKNRDFLKRAQKGMEKWWELMEDRGRGATNR